MYSIFTYIYHKNHLNVGKYTIHGSYGNIYITYPPHNHVPKHHCSFPNFFFQKSEEQSDKVPTSAVCGFLSQLGQLSLQKNRNFRMGLLGKT